MSKGRSTSWQHKLAADKMEADKVAADKAAALKAATDKLEADKLALEIEPRVGPSKVGVQKYHAWGGTLAIFEVLSGCF